ncbi:hypothetical protein [Gellertiella hungarica]|uniref:Uncharacterized protein n=1 Tax=Gellertiella hungarica TaxID=1572859 RepID=A0A7W6J5D4_9HYPH|nr:hypothetical protein [Gellertiella hungarica]MBB4064221.1 hypothetical protein [Gellertiella hungarica]
MNDVEQNDGIDFFDFLYEVWSIKWTAVGALLVLTVAGALWPFVGRAGVPELVAVEEPLTGRVPFILKVLDDPVQRTAGALVLDLAARVDPEGKLGLRYAGYVTDDGKTPLAPLTNEARTFQFIFDGSANSGVIRIAIPSGTANDLKAASDAISAAATEQAKDAAEIAEGTTDLLKTTVGYTANPEQPVLANRLVASVQFLANPKVKAGSFRFFQTQRVEILDRQKPSMAEALPSNGRSIKSAAIGLYLVC